MKNATKTSIKNTNKANKSSKNEGWDDCNKDIQNNSQVAWAVEINGEISPCNICSTRSYAREVRKDIMYNLKGFDEKVSVRKVLILAIKGR